MRIAVPDAFLTKVQRHGLHDDDFANLASNYHSTIHVSAHADILDCEAPHSHIMILLEGWACKYQIMRNGGRQIISILLPGDICNLDSLCRSSLPSSVSAMTDCHVATFGIDWLKKTIHERPAIRDLILSTMVEENAAITDRIVSLGGRSSRQRVAHFLLDLLTRLEVLGQAVQGTLRLPLTQEDIGDALGLSTVHVNRTLQTLRDEGLVASKGRTYTIRDRGRLQALAAGTNWSSRTPAEALAS